MGDEQREELARLFAENEDFTAAIMGATSVAEAISIARGYGIDATVEDFGVPDGSLGDAELEGIGGGALFPSYLECPTQKRCTAILGGTCGT